MWYTVVFATAFLAAADGADPVLTPATIPADSVGNTADDVSVVTWAELTEGDPYAASTPERVSSGLVGFYNMANGFVSAVFVKGFPEGV